MADISIQKLIKSNLKDQILPSVAPTSSTELSLEEVAQEFESLFVNQMLKSARSAKLSEGLLDNEAYETYQGLLDQEYSKTLAKNHNFGIAEGLIRQFEKRVDGKK